MLQKLWMVSSLSVLLLQSSCGPKNDVVDLDNIKWSDEKAELYPSSSLAIEGEASGNKPYLLSFALTDKDGQPIDAKTKGLEISYNRPPSGKTTLSFQNDLSVRVESTSDVCNGDYILVVKAKLGQASSSRPLPFKVVGGRSNCQMALNKPNEFVKQGTIGNRIGRDMGAFDLVGGTRVWSHKKTYNQDLQDLTLNTDSYLSQKIGSQTGAKFVKTNSNFDTITYEKARTDFAQLVPTDSTGKVTQGDVYIVSTPRNNQALYVIKILVVDVGTKSKNNGHITFAYKKLSPQ